MKQKQPHIHLPFKNELRLPAENESRPDITSAISSATNESCSLMFTSGMQSQTHLFKSFKVTPGESASTPSEGLTNIIPISFEEFLPQIESTPQGVQSTNKQYPTIPSDRAVPQKCQDIDSSYYHSRKMSQPRTTQIRNRSDPRSTRCDLLNSFLPCSNINTTTVAETQNIEQLENQRKNTIRKNLIINPPQACPNNSLIIDSPTNNTSSLLKLLLPFSQQSLSYESYFLIKRLQVASASPNVVQTIENKPICHLEEVKGEEYLMLSSDTNSLLPPSDNLSHYPHGTAFESSDENSIFIVNKANSPVSKSLQNLQEKEKLQTQRIQVLEEKLVHYKEELRSKQGICDLKDIQITQLLDEKEKERMKKQKWKSLFNQTSQLAQEYRTELNEERKKVGLRQSLESASIANNNNNSLAPQGNQHRISKTTNYNRDSNDTFSSQKVKTTPSQQHLISSSEASTSCNSRHQDSTNTHQSASLSASEKSLESFPIVTEFQFHKPTENAMKAQMNTIPIPIRENNLSILDNESIIKLKHRRSLTASQQQQPQQSNSAVQLAAANPSNEQINISRLLHESIKSKFSTISSQFSTIQPSDLNANRSRRMLLNSNVNKSFEDQVSLSSSQQVKLISLRKFSKESGSSTSTLKPTTAMTRQEGSGLAARKPPRYDAIAQSSSALPQKQYQTHN